MILGGGPNRIGQGIEFDYCCVHACQALRAAGFETVMVNSNPETVSPDYDTSDRLYFEPVTLEDVLEVYRRERCDGAIVQFGGQTPLNLALDLKSRRRERHRHQSRRHRKGRRPRILQAAGRPGRREAAGERHGTDLDGALAIARRVGFPVLVRPSFVLGGRAMAIVYTEPFFAKFCAEAFAASEGAPC
jgi:carbamoyl-phosphate synthase large subunit